MQPEHTPSESLPFLHLSLIGNASLPISSSRERRDKSVELTSRCIFIRYPHTPWPRSLLWYLHIPTSEALSYTWVSAEDLVAISINSSNTQPSNNAKLLVTQNLAAALPSSTWGLTSNTVDRCHLHLFGSILNGIPRKLEVWPPVFRGDSFADRITISFLNRLRVALLVLCLILCILILRCTNFSSFRRNDIVCMYLNQPWV
jgi:hypothetical protein